MVLKKSKIQEKNIQEIVECPFLSMGCLYTTKYKLVPRCFSICCNWSRGKRS